MCVVDTKLCIPYKTKIRMQATFIKTIIKCPMSLLNHE